jgi:hypothetical protein
MKTYWRRRSIAPPFLTSSTVWRVVSFTTRPFYLRGKIPWYQLDARLGTPQSRPERCGKKNNLLILPGIEPRPSSPLSRLLMFSRTLRASTWPVRPRFLQDVNLADCNDVTWHRRRNQVGLGRLRKCCPAMYAETSDVRNGGNMLIFREEYPSWYFGCKTKWLIKTCSLRSHKVIVIHQSPSGSCLHKHCYQQTYVQIRTFWSDSTISCIHKHHWHKCWDTVFNVKANGKYGYRSVWFTVYT